jgi:O-antigen/teichoic acid export membrane protein
MVIGVFASVLTVPFNAQINAYEDLGIDAFLSVVESVLKLASAFIIGFVDNPLTALGVLFVSTSFLMLLVKALFCMARYRECRLLSTELDRVLLREMVGFTSWNSFGAVCGVARVQGLAIVLNNFFGVTINAVYAIAMQVNGKLKEFSINIMKAINPKIVKAESNGQRSEMLNLSMQASRFSLLLYSVIALPIYFETDFILSLWLGEYPQQAVPFVKLFLILSLVNLTTIGLQTAIQAIGDVKAYQSTIGSVLLLTIPFAYAVLTLGYPAYSVIIVSIIMEVVSCVMRLGFLRKKAGLSVHQYAIFVLAKALQVLAPTGLVLFAFTSSYEPGYLRFVSSGFISFGMIAGLTYWLVLSTEEKKLIRLKV